MNYYIQGDAAKADKIKAAFEEKGYKTGDAAFNDKDLYYATFHGDVYIIATDCLCYEFFKRLVELGDYKELELPVQPKFKDGDKVVFGTLNETIAVVLINEQRYLCESCREILFDEQDQWHLAPKPHYDIKNFHAGMPVLVRETSLNAWQYVLFSHCYMGGDGLTRFNAGLVGFTQCIPFEGNEHLLGTTDMPSEEYINW